jgi:hypothetical protein
MFPSFSKLFWPSAKLDHGGGSGIVRRIFLRFWKMRAFCKAQDHPRQMCKAALVLQIVLVDCETTSSEASTGVADLDAA